MLTVSPGGAKECSHGRKPVVGVGLLPAKPRQGRHRSHVYPCSAAPSGAHGQMPGLDPWARALGYSLSPLPGLATTIYGHTPPTQLCGTILLRVDTLGPCGVHGCQLALNGFDILAQLSQQIWILIDLRITESLLNGSQFDFPVDHQRLQFLD